jgi:hypothetical protein
MSAIPITEENSITVLVNSVKFGQKMGAYALREAKLLKQAIDYFDANKKEKPTFDGADNPKLAAINLLLQGVQKAQAHGGEYAFSFDDAALLWDITEFWIKEGGKAVTQNVNLPSSSQASKDKSAKAAKTATSGSTVNPVVKLERSTEETDDDEEDDDDDEPTITVSQKKGKRRE